MTIYVDRILILVVFLYQHGGFEIPFLATGGFLLVILFSVYWILPTEECKYSLRILFIRITRLISSKK